VAGGVDAHAHAWVRPFAFIPGARYRPDYDAPVDAWVAHLDRHGLEQGLLIQPSFFGHDNSQMLDAVSRHPGRLRAVVMIHTSTPDEELARLEARGAVGVRYNLIGLPLPDFAAEPQASFVRRLAARGWHVEIHREARDLHALLPPLLSAGVRVAVDHFGRPDATKPVDDPGFRYLLTHGRSGRVWVKLSAAYRCGGDAAARKLTPMLLDHYPPERLPWASDWPHTQHESRVSYDSTFALFEATVSDAKVRARCLAAATELLAR
jgi:predicted TIM-barrel fold metal-dependent hydrolase